MLNAISELLSHRWTWRVTGFVSSIVGFYCYALSPSAQYWIGAWSLVKMLAYSLVSSLVCTCTLLVHRDSCAWARGRGPFFKTQLGFVALVITSVFSFLEDRSEEGKKESGYGKTMNVISGAAFASMAMSFSMELELGFEVGVSNFMIGWFLVRAMKVRLMIAIVATLFCYMLVNLRHILNISRPRRGATPDNESSHRDIPLETISHPLMMKPRRGAIPDIESFYRDIPLETIFDLLLSQGRPTHGEDADGMNTESQSTHQDTDLVPNSLESFFDHLLPQGRPTHGEDADGMNTESQSTHQDTDLVPNSDSQLRRRPVAVVAQQDARRGATPDNESSHPDISLETISHPLMMKYITRNSR